MNLIFPIAASDRNHISGQTRLLKAFGPYLEDRALILPTPNAMADPMIRPHIDALMALFAPENVKLEVTPNDFGASWPYSPGCHFRHAMDTIDLIGWSDQESSWFEPDLYPTRPNWLRLVKDDYRMASTPFRGMIEKTRWEDTNPKTKEVTPRYDGTTHLVGAGIYPKDYIRYICPINRSTMASYRSPSYSIPFDVKCQAQHLPATQSPLWLHRLRTVNWKHLGGTLFSCEDQKKDPFGLTYAGECDLSQVCLVHGPKDSSFADAILVSGLGELTPKVTATASVETAPHSPEVLAKKPLPEKPWDNVTVPGEQSYDSSEESRESQLLERINDLEEDLKMQVENNASLFQKMEELAKRVGEKDDEIAALQVKLLNARTPAPSTESKPVKKGKKPIRKTVAVEK